MADVPDTLTLKRHRDFDSRVGRRPFVRWILLWLLAVPILLGLLNVFGQRPSTEEAAVDTARLSVYAPTNVRGGLYFEARFHISAHDELKDARLVLDSNWVEGLTINTIEPSPLGAASRDGDLSYDLGHIAAGDSYVLYVQEQVNPTNVGSRPLRAELWDGERHLLTVERQLRVWP